MLSRLYSLAQGRPAYDLASLRGDNFGGPAAGAVMLPMSMGYGVISGLGPAAGLHGTIDVCLFAALFGRTRGLISGPNLLAAVAMAVVITEYTTTLAEAVTVVILVGIIQMGFGVLRFGRYVSYTPYSLLSGIFTGAGILLIVMQGLPGMGGRAVDGGVIDQIKAWPAGIATVNTDALALVVGSIILGFLWRGAPARLAPAPFVVMAVGTVAGAVWLQDAPTIGEIPAGLPALRLPVISLEFLLRALEPAFMLAIPSSVDTLITALFADSMTGSRHKPNQELISQGIGNAVTGFIGGNPGAVTTVGSLINLTSGGRSPLAGVAAAAVLLSAFLGLGSLLENIPNAVLAGILITMGWGVIDWRYIGRLHRVPREYAFVMLTTVFVAILVDFVTAIFIGLVVSGLIGARRSERPELQRLISVPLLDSEILPVDEADPYEARTGLIALPDRVSVASARELIRILRSDIEGHQIVILDLSRTVYIDDTAAVVIGQLIANVLANGSQSIAISGLSGEAKNTLDSLGVLDRVPLENFANNLAEAKKIVRPMLTSLP